MSGDRAFLRGFITGGGSRSSQGLSSDYAQPKDRVDKYSFVIGGSESRRHTQINKDAQT